MSPRRPRALHVALATVVVLIATLGAGGSWLFNTPRGARWGFERLGAILPGKLDVVELRGPLRGPLEIHKLTYRTETAEVTIDRLEIDWRLSQLWRRRLDIHRLYAEDVRWLVGKSGDRPAERDSLASPLPDVDLPVSILIRDGLVNRMQITTSARDTGILIDRIVLDAQSLKDGLRVKRLVVQSRPIDLTFEGRVLPRGNYPLALAGRWSYRTPRGGRFAGEGIFEGTLDTLRVFQEMSAPFTGSVHAVLVRLGHDTRFDATVRFAELHPQEVDPGWPAGTFAGWLRASGALDRFTGQGSLHGTSELLGAANADFRLARSDGDWRLQGLDVVLPRTDTRIHAHGSLHPDSVASRFRLAARWTQLEWPSHGEPMVSSERGDAELEGTTRDFGVRVQARLAGPRMPAGKWRLEGRGGDGRIAIRTVIADLLDGRIVGRGTVAWSPRVAWQMRFDGKNLDPGAAWKPWPGNLSFAARSEGAMGAHGPNGRVLISGLSGTLRRQPVSGGGTLTARDGQYALSGVGLWWGPNRLEAAGSFGHRWALEWNLAAPALGVVLPDGSGALASQGSIRGSRARPHVTGTLRGDSVYFGRTHAGSLRASGDVNLAPGGVVRLDVIATKVDAGGRTAERLLMTARGTSDRHELRTSIGGRRDSLVTVLAGGFAGDDWRGVLRALDLAHRNTGRWGLAAPARLVMSRERIEVRGFDWRSGPSSLTLAADWRRMGPWRVDSRLDQVKLSLLDPLLPSELRLQGPLRGHVRARGDANGALHCDADLVPGPGEVFYRNTAGKWIPTRFDHGRLRVDADGRRLSTELRADLVRVGSVRATLGLPAYSLAVPPSRQPLDGSLQLHLRDLALAQGLSRELEATGGQLDADLRFGGTVGRPTVQGPLRIRDGVATLPRLGIQAREIQVEAQSGAGGKLSLEGSLRSGPGKLAFGGHAAFAPGARSTAKLDVKGERVQAMGTRDMNLLVSPDLHVALAGERVDVTGELVVPEGTIEVGRTERKSLVRTSPDVALRGADTLARGPLAMHSKVRVVVGKKVTFRGFGIELKPTGSVLAIDEPGRPTRATGKLASREGTYQIYGQELQIENAELVFGGGPILNPSVRARAFRKAGDVTAGFDVSGTVSKPNVRVFSRPAMGESQALSYILFGKPLEKGTLSQGQLASTIATTMGVRGSNLLAHGVASKAGIEQARIEAGDDFHNASLMLGTHLSPKLYVSYGVGIFESVAALRLKYLMSSRWAIEAETAEQNRVDLMWTAER